MSLPNPDQTYDLSRRHVNPTRGSLLEAFLGTRIVMGRREGPRFENLADGRWYWNCHSNGGVFNLGHRPPAVIAAVTEALETVDIGNHYFDSPWRAELSRRLAQTTGGALEGVVLSPSGGEATDVALKFARAQSGKGSATVVASTLVGGPMEAALTNGVLAHSDETDDSHGESQSHPGAAIVPAALAAGEEFDISGERFLRAVTLGYDVGPRVTIAMGGVDFRNESHKSTHAIAGVFGAAAAAACNAESPGTTLTATRFQAGSLSRSRHSNTKDARP